MKIVDAICSEPSGKASCGVLDAKQPVVINPVFKLIDAIVQACGRIPPLWPLQQFVAVNPFLGLMELPFLQACNTIRRVTHSDMLMPVAFYQQQLASGRMTDADIAHALASIDVNQANALGSAAQVKAQLAGLSEWEESLVQVDAISTVADHIDHCLGTQWAAFVVDEISKWCAAYFDEGQASWRMPWRSLPLFTAWKQAASYDRNPEIAGIVGFRDAVAKLPDSPLEAIQTVIAELGIADSGLIDFLHRQLMTVNGWSAFVQYRVRESTLHGEADDMLVHLLAIRLVWEYALNNAFADVGLPSTLTEEEPVVTECKSLQLLNVLQTAYEMAHQRALLAELAKNHKAADTTIMAASKRKTVQAVFCIDVRSEVYRRALETVSNDVETLGFAGFFGFPIEYIRLGHSHGAAHCPVLLTPKFRIREGLYGASAQELHSVLTLRWSRKRLAKLWKAFKTSAVSCFSYVEVGGLLFGIKLVTDSFGLTRTVTKPGTEGLDTWVVERIGPLISQQTEAVAGKKKAQTTGLQFSERVELAKNALQGMGLTANFAHLVLLCGHGSSTVNNPYASGLDCGACGGQTGEANARVAAAVLNDWEVRAALNAQGIAIHPDTWFLAALHNTTTDTVSLFDQDLCPRKFSGELAQLSRWLAKASKLAREERSVILGLAETDPLQLAQAIEQRTRDWSQIRPEWGLAGNAAFIAAPRSRSQNAKLGGRVFLHNYDHEQDPQGDILELIMTAPLVVASWINLQYYASTVNNRLFGSGNKIIHNVVGTLGVLQGNGGDLQVGLPWQSLHDGQKLVHEPMRLSVFIEAPQAAIEAVIEKHESVRQLVDNHWLHLFRIASEDSQYFRYLGVGNWLAEPVGYGELT